MSRLALWRFKHAPGSAAPRCTIYKALRQIDRFILTSYIQWTDVNEQTFEIFLTCTYARNSHCWCYRSFFSWTVMYLWALAREGWRKVCDIPSVVGT